MNSMDLLDLIGEAKDIYLLETQKYRSGYKEELKLKRKMKPIVIAALIALMILMMGCAVVWMTLQDMKIGEQAYTPYPYIDENGEKVYEAETTRDVISLQGIKGSPSQIAAQEWYEFEQSYDPDNKLLEESDENPIDIPAKYDAYFIYTQEMMDKVDEIAQKYDLELAGAFAGTQAHEMQIFFDALGMESLHHADAKAEVEYLFGYFYECGNFNMEFALDLTGEETKWPHEILTSMRYCGKGYLDTVFTLIDQADDFEQWSYTMADGNEVLIVQGDDWARIFFDSEDAFVSVSFNTTYEDAAGHKEYMSKRDLELVAETLDFTVSPQKPDMADVEKKLEASYQEELARQEAQMETWEDPFVHDSYAEQIGYILENGASPEDYYYALQDVNGDGVEDLILGMADSFGTVMTMRDGETTILLSVGTDWGCYLCENGIIEYNDKRSNENEHTYYQLDGYEAKCIDRVGYDVWEESWFRMEGGYLSDKEYITEAEANNIIAAYARIDIEMKPISGFPTN